MQFKKLESEERLRKGQIEIEIRKIEIDREIKLRELELAGAAAKQYDSYSSKFDVTRHIRLVPTFQDKEVDKYFLHFEKVAENLNWPVEHWTLLLQSVLIGKARDIYTQLTVEQSSSYQDVKELILKGYELVPEAYRQKIRTCKRENEQTHMEFAREKEQLFDRWCSSKKIGESQEKL